MGKRKYSAEEIILFCKRYRNGEGGYNYLANEMGCSPRTLKSWYRRYIAFGNLAFEKPAKYNSYSDDFKQEVVDAYFNGEGSSVNIAIKYNIADGMVRSWISLYNNGRLKKFTRRKRRAKKMQARKSPFERRLDIVTYVINNNMDYKRAAEKYVLPYHRIYRWTKNYLKYGEDALKFSSRNNNTITNKSKEKSKIKNLQKELEKSRAKINKLELENEILKKKKNSKSKYFIKSKTNK